MYVRDVQETDFGKCEQPEWWQEQPRWLGKGIFIESPIFLESMNKGRFVLSFQKITSLDSFLLEGDSLKLSLERNYWQSDNKLEQNNRKHAGFGWNFRCRLGQGNHFVHRRIAYWWC